MPISCRGKRRLNAIFSSSSGFGLPLLILVADADPAARLDAVTQLRTLGHQCISTDDGAKAWGICQTRRPDVVVCGNEMPGLTGLELFRKVRAQTDRYTYLIMVTGRYSREAKALEAMNAGADDLLLKPLNPGALEVRLIVAARLSAQFRQMAHQRTKLASAARREALTRKS